jgi:hypothetical protein
MKYRSLLIAALALLPGLQSHADSLQFKDGKTLTGKYAGGTAGTINFQTTQGMQVIDASQIVALSFNGQGATTPAAAGANAAQPPAAGANPPAAASAQAGPGTTQPAIAPATAGAAPAAAGAAPAAVGSSTGGAVSIPTGTPLLVRMVDPVSSQDAPGKAFTATLESDLAANGVVVAKAGTKVYGVVQSSQQARRYSGQSALDLRLTKIAAGSSMVPISTSGYVDASSRSGGKVARGAAGGAAIGAIADGGEGAGKGAAIGAVASGIKKGETVSVPPGTLLEFKLQQPLSVNVAK